MKFLVKKRILREQIKHFYFKSILRAIQKDLIFDDRCIGLTF